MKYTTSFKKAVLRKVLPPENRSIHSVSVELGVGEMTIHRWIAQAERFHSTLKTEHVRQPAIVSNLVRNFDFEKSHISIMLR